MNERFSYIYIYKLFSTCPRGLFAYSYMFFGRGLSIIHTFTTFTPDVHAVGAPKTQVELYGRANRR
jgi:hypothetical protein